MPVRFSTKNRKEGVRNGSHGGFNTPRKAISTAPFPIDGPTFPANQGILGLTHFIAVDTPVHHLANIHQASAAFGIFCPALTVSQRPFRLDPIENRGMAVGRIVPSNVLGGVFETIANPFWHHHAFDLLPALYSGDLIK
jgi:hypothetical protein